MMDEQQPMQQDDPMSMPFGGFRAQGGPVDPRRRYVVGENGPEDFVPDEPGTIVPRTGQLVASSRGGYQWQPGTGAGTSAPPQSGSRGGMPRSIDAAFDGGTLTSRAPGGEMTGPLSSRKRQIGGGMTPERRLKQMQRRALTRGDDATVTSIAQAQAGMEQRGIDRAFQEQQRGVDRNFARERDAVNFEQGKTMWGMDRAFQGEAEARRRQDALDAEERRNQRGDSEWNRSRAAELEDRANSAIDAPFTMTDPSGQFMIPGVKTKGGDFKPMGGAYPMPKPGATPQQVRSQQADAEKRGYDLIQLPTGEWRLEKKATPRREDAGRETETYDADGTLTGRTRTRPLGSGDSSGSAPPPRSSATPSSFLNRLGR